MRQLLTRSTTPRAVGVGLLFAVVAATLAASTQAASTAKPKAPTHRVGGFIPARIHSGAPPPQAPLGSGDLVWHGGPVMKTNKAYAIYWIPAGYSVSANYTALINRYFTDVAAASGATSNVYAVETQYYDGTGSVTTSSTFGGSVVDTNPFPVNGCSAYMGLSKCLSDAQLISEINKVITAQGWVKNSTTQFFMFTPKNVGSCDSPGSCAFSTFCAYHGYSGGLIYANQPYAAIANCNGGQSPNSDDADQTINVTSHEHREAINDFQLNAWYDAAGYEGSDKCAWMFGSMIGGSPGHQYNQLINGNPYFLQQEYSNDGHACLLSYSPGALPPSISSFSPTSGPVGTSVSISGSNFTGATGVTFNGTAATSFTVDSAASITVAVPTGATTGKISVATPNGTATSTGTFTVSSGSSPPTISSISPTSGPVGTSVTINGSNFSGVTGVTFNGTAATTYTVNSTAKITATVPSGATTGKVSVSTGGGTATSSQTFTVTTGGGGSAPTITSFSPTSGHAGALVTITGTNLNGATSVQLGSATAAFTVVSSTKITATVPAVRGFLKWRVTTPGGTATSSGYFFAF